MSGAMRRIGEYLGLVEDTGRYDEYDGHDETVETRPVASPRAHKARTRNGGDRIKEDPPKGVDPSPIRVKPVCQPRLRRLPRRRPAPGPTGVVAELSRITTLHPSTYNEARTVGEHFREGIPVIMNLTEMDDSDAKRLVDFAAGLVFATRGTIERVTNKVFLLSPHNVSVTAEDKERIVEGGFFNQS